MAPIAETAIVVAEKASTVAEVTKEIDAASKAIKETTKEVAEGTAEQARRIESYAQQYLAENRPSSPYIKDKIEAAAQNSETRPALMNDIISDGKLKGSLNEQERIADLKPNCKDLKTEIKVGDNRVDITGETNKPIRITKVHFDESTGVFERDSYIRAGEKFSMECKDGKLNYLRGNLEHISQQVKAGKELSGERSLLQITEQNFQELAELSLDEQNEFYQAITEAGGEIIVMETTLPERIAAINQAILMAGI